MTVNHVKITAATPDHHPEILIDGFDPGMIDTVEILITPNDAPLVTFSLAAPTLDLDLYGILSPAIHAVLIDYLECLADNPAALADLERRSHEWRPSGFGGHPGDTALGFIRALISVADGDSA